MPFYNRLSASREVDRRTATGLLRLRAALLGAIPPKTLDDTVLIASWNLREFGGSKHGGRTKESLFYIAEVIDHFDLVAVQEVRDDLRELDALMSILGSWWKYVITDVTPGPSGNGERMAFIYDQRKLSFGGLAGEVSPALIKNEDGMLGSPFGFARSPYMVGFRAGWFKFSICTGHLYYGKSRADDPQRLAEMQALVSLLEKRIKSADRWARNVVLLGDFNVFSELDETFAALTNAFKKPLALDRSRSNVNRTKAFDQIAFLAPDVDLQLEKAKGGVFDFYEHVYRPQERETYGKNDLKKFRDWRTYQMSDHLPIWVELLTDFGLEYLQRKTDPTAEQSRQPVVQPVL